MSKKYFWLIAVAVIAVLALDYYAQTHPGRLPFPVLPWSPLISRTIRAAPGRSNPPNPLPVMAGREN